MPLDALFLPDGDRYIPTELTRGGWSDDAQHGGPPGGLLGRAVEQHASDQQMEVVRLTVDLIRPVPLTPLTVRSRLARNGNRVQLVEAALEADGVEVALARGLRIRRTKVPLPDVPEPSWVARPGPDSGEAPDLTAWGGGTTRFHLDSVEIRSIGATFERAGQGLAWIRLVPNLVAGEAVSPFVRLATLADMGNAVGRVLDHRRYTYVNPDITLAVHTPAEPEWIGFEGASYPRESGMGVADTLVFDEAGPIGRIIQSQLIEEH